MNRRTLSKLFRESLTCSSVLICIFCWQTQAQQNTAQVSGTITDPSGSPVPGATVTLENMSRGVARTATSDTNGGFHFDFVVVGGYRLTVSHAGFSTLVRPGLELSTGQVLDLPLKLELQQLSQTVEVQSEVAALDTTSAEQRATLNVTQLNTLPVAHQDWTNLLQLSAGTTKPAPVSTTASAFASHSTGGSGVNVNGLPASGYGLTVDGTVASDNPEFIAYNFYQTSSIINTVNNDAIEELSVAKGIPPATVSNAMSGSMNIVTKSGTNAYHGGLYEINEVSLFDARNQFLTSRPRTVFNEYGGSFGAPVLKNRLFFFGSYEGARLVSSSLVAGLVPSPYLHSIAPPVYSSLLALFPKAPQPASNPTATSASFIGPAATVKTDGNTVGRLDYYANQNNMFAVRYIRARPYLLTPNLLPSNPRTYSDHGDAVNVTYTHSSSRWVENTRFGDNRLIMFREDLAWAAQVPSLTFGFNTGGPNLMPVHGGYVTFQEGVAAVFGRHTLQFGGIFQRDDDARLQTASPSIGYATLTQFLNNTPSGVGLNIWKVPSDVPTIGLSTFQYGAYIQDDWKITTNLTLNLGLRYDLFTVPQEYHGRFYNRGVDPNNPQLGFGFGPFRPTDSALDGNHLNFQPRIGLAYNVHGNGKTVIRSGFGIMTADRPLILPITGVRISATLPVGVGLNQLVTQASGIKYPIDPTLYRQQIAQLQAQGILSTNLASQAEPPNGDSPHSIQYMFGIEQALPFGMTLETDFNGNRGISEWFSWTGNLPNRLTGVAPAPNFGTFGVYSPTDRSKYAALQVTLRKRYQKGLLFSGGLTWSKVNSFGDADLLLANPPQDISNIRADWGPAPFDIRLRFVGSVVWDVPLDKWSHTSGRAAKLLFAGWQLSGILAAQTGTPVNITNSSSSYFNARPDAQGSISPYRSGYQSGVHQYLNPAAFIQIPLAPASSAQMRDGNLQRDAIYAPGLWNLDGTLSKSFALAERLQLQLRADTFNTLNHTNLGGLITTVNSGGIFGQLTQATARTMQLGARVSF